MDGMQFWANLAEIVGAIVVVITLIYLSLQLRQNNHLLRSESRRAIAENEKAALQLGIQYQEVLRKLDQPGDLSAKEQFELSIIFVLDLENRFFEYRQYKNGVLDKQTWEAHQHVLKLNHSNPRGRRWWNKLGRNFYDDEFVGLVDDLIREEIPASPYKAFAEWDDD